MTHAYAARRLLEHGPLYLDEFTEITGWSYYSCKKVLAKLRADGFIRSVRVGSGVHRSFYELV